MNTLDRLEKINNDCQVEVEKATAIYFAILKDADERKHRAWVSFTKTKRKIIAKRDKLITEFQKEIDGAVLPANK